jgi:hypothetical protein
MLVRQRDSVLPSEISRSGLAGLPLRCGPGELAGTPARLPQPRTQRRRTSAAPFAAAAGLRQGPGTKRPRQPMTAGQRRAATNHQAPHAPSRPERSAGKVRGGAASGAAPPGARGGTGTWPLPSPPSAQRRGHLLYLRLRHSPFDLYRVYLDPLNRVRRSSDPHPNFLGFLSGQRGKQDGGDC